MRDDESDGQPTPDAMGDDNNVSDDEDGVIFTSLPLDRGTWETVDIEVLTVVTANLTAWIDFNRNGSWGDPGEQIFNVTLTSGTYGMTFYVPYDAVPGNTFARFRISEESGLSYTGHSDTGEVEDYMIEIAGEPSPLTTPRIRDGEEGVGGDVYPVNKPALLIPWIALSIVIISGGIYLVKRRVGN